MADTWHARQSLYGATYGLIPKSHSVRAPRPSLRLSLVLHNGAARVTKGAPHHHLEAVEAIPETIVMQSRATNSMLEPAVSRVAWARVA